MTVVSGGNAVPAKPASNAPATPEVLTEDALIAQLTALGAAANRNDAKAKELLVFCRAHPEAWTLVQNLEQDAIDSWLALLAPGNHGDTAKAEWKRAHIAEQLQRRRTEIRGDGDSQLETLLINRILSTWLQVMYADVRYAQMRQRDGTFRQMEYAQKRLERANRQLIRAIQALATVRRLLQPVQVNIGQNQINVAR
jgi:hypothetical protein